MNDPQTTASETYRTRREDVARLLDWLGMELEKADQAAAAAPRDWSIAGSMGRIRNDLIDLLESVSGIERELIEETLDEHE